MSGRAFCFRSFRKFSLAYCLSCLVFALFVRVPHSCIEMIFDNRLTLFCDCARFFLRAMRLVFFLRISRKSYSGFMCLAASLPDAAVGRCRVFCVNSGTFCLDGAIRALFLSFSVIPVQNIAISCGVFSDFLCCFFLFCRGFFVFCAEAEIVVFSAFTDRRRCRPLYNAFFIERGFCGYVQNGFVTPFLQPSDDLKPFFAV